MAKADSVERSTWEQSNLTDSKGVIESVEVGFELRLTMTYLFGTYPASSCEMFVWGER